MKKNKVKKLTKSIITVIITVLLILLGVQSVATAGTITMSDVDSMRYTLNTKMLYHFYESTGRYNNLYCINAGASRRTGDTLTQGGSIYNMDEKTIQTIFTTRERYNSFIWLVDNMYIANNVDAVTKAMMLENISNLVKSKEKVIEQEYGIELDSNWIDGMIDDYSGRETLIYAVQQCLIWYFTNNQEAGMGDMTPNSISSATLIVPGDGKDNSTEYTSTKYYCYIYTALRSLAEENSNYVSPNATSISSYVNNIFLDSTNAIIDRKTAKVGPFVIQNDTKPVPELIKYTVMVNDVELSAENYQIIEDGNNIYIQLNSNYKLEDAKEYTIKLVVDLKIISTQAEYFYTPGDLINKQPLVNLKKNVIGKQVEGRARTEAVAEFDLHLIKNITDVYAPVNDNGTTKYVLIKTDDVQNLKAATVLVNRAYSRIGNLVYGAQTDVYLTNKTYVTVPTGSIIKYKITIHNEGDLDGYAEEITDNLSNGLEFVSLEQLQQYGINETVDYGWEKVDKTTAKVSAVYKTNYLSSQRDINNIIKAYESETNTIDSKEVYIYCKVTSKDSEDTLKNVAEITADKAYDADNNYEDIPDRDSTPASLTIEEITTEINDWKGSSPISPNEMDERGKYSVPGKQDDDDFENLKVETLDLALTKEITRIEYKVEDDSEVTTVKDRLKAYQTAGLLDNTTASYIMNKPALGVKTGAVVKYKITVYNEGSINGYATKITDYLPAGLEFVEDSDINNQYNWKASKNEDGTTTISTNYLKDTELKLYSGGEILDSAFVEIECKVVSEEIGRTLTNIAEITEYGYYIGAEYIQAVADENGNPSVDRDSYQDSINVQLNKTNIAENISEYENRVNAQQIRNNMNKTDYDVEDDDDFEQIIIKDREYDLALRKYISAVNGNNLVDGKNLTSYTENVTRIPLINDFSNTINRVMGTATYYHGKEAIEVYPEDEITYTLRVYNEGGIIDYDGIATEITDYLPQGLEFVKIADGYEDYTATVDKELNAVKITYNGNKIIPSNTIEKIANCVQEQKYDEISEQWYQEVAIICKVTIYKENKILTNRAEITAQKAFDKQGNIVEIADRDSTPNSLISEQKEIAEKIAILNLDNYYTDYILGINDDHLIYYKGLEGNGTNYSLHQDDIDFENIKIKKISGKYSIQLLKIDGKNSNKKLEDVTFVVESLRNGIKDEIVFGPTDTNGLTQSLETQIENLDIDAYTITEVDVGDNEYVALKEDITIYVSKELIGGAFRAKAISFDSNSFDYAFGSTIYKTVELEDNRKVEISAILSSDGIIAITIPNLEEIKDFDLALRKFIVEVQTPTGTLTYEDRCPVFKITEDGKYIYKHDKTPVIVDTNNIVTYTLRIYNEGETYGYASKVLDDIPEGLEFVSYTVGDGSVNDTYRWIMYKEVTEEEIANLPEGIQVFELDGRATANTEAITEMKKCIITTNVAEADYIVTDYLSYENGEKMVENLSIDPETLLPYNPNLLKPFNPETMSEPDYRDIKVQFKVIEPTTSNRTIENLAQIVEDKDKYNEPVEDIDSTPNVWIDTDDDQDIEKIRVRYFDLALVKWVSEAVVIEDGVEKVIKGNNLEDLENQYDHRLIYDLYPETIGKYTDLEPIVKVDIPKSKINDVVVKFKYKIRVYNEGQIDGYATEIIDYIPDNMKFVQEDNPLWTLDENGNAVTNQLANTLLKAEGEPQTIEIVYTWVNGENNIGLLVNTAEISEDYNEYGTPDIDSTPSNYTVNEDDIDDAPVMLSVRTGNEIPVQYILVTLSVVLIISTGVILIKKFVL